MNKRKSNIVSKYFLLES